jgi:hypothetical protein
MARSIWCYAEGTGDKWEAFCLDFDLAVQGRSFDEVAHKLEEQIEIYIEGVMAQPPEQRQHLLMRRVPWTERVRLLIRVLCAVLVRPVDQHSYRIQAPAELAAA